MAWPTLTHLPPAWTFLSWAWRAICANARRLLRQTCPRQKRKNAQQSDLVFVMLQEDDCEDETSGEFVSTSGVATAASADTSGTLGPSTASGSGAGIAEGGSEVSTVADASAGASGATASGATFAGANVFSGVASGVGGASSAAIRADNTSTNRSTNFLAPLPSGSLSGLYCAMSSARRFLCLTISCKIARASLKGRPPLPGTFTLGNSEASSTSGSRWTTNSRVTACNWINAFCADLFAPFKAMSAI